MEKKALKYKYILSDFFTSSVVWSLFFILRKVYIDKFEVNYPLYQILNDINYIKGLIVIPFFWIFLYSLQGYYKHLYRRSRLHEYWQTFIITLIGSLLIFFVLILDDQVVSYNKYYQSFLLLFGLHFFITYLPRYFITAHTNNKILNRKIGFNTLLIGSNEKAIKLYERLEFKKYSSGNRFIGFINVFQQDNYVLSKYLDHLGDVSNLVDIIKQKNVEEVIIAIESKEHTEIEKILTQLEVFNIVVKAIPDNTDLISGKVRISSLFDEPLIHISHDLMPAWQESTKRMIDILASLFVLIVFSPLYLFLAIGVKLSSPGPIIYSHQRIGKNGIPFTIYKFRSMYMGSEKNGPELTQEKDNRITRFGNFIRKTRLDEFPQFYNVLKGEMSLVGPRPERDHFINQIVQVAPHYAHLHKVRPGITSLGQVKYGYAKNIDEMVERLRYDIIYIENMSLYIDIKILIYTIRTVFLGKGL